MKVIFLDVDGVLNNVLTFKRTHEVLMQTGIRPIDIDVERLQLIRDLSEETNSKIVLSSARRKGFRSTNGRIIPRDYYADILQKTFMENGIDIYDITPVDSSNVRELEIRKWLEGKDIETFVIFDDDFFDLQGFIDKELVLVRKNSSNPYGGLTEEHISKAREILNRNIFTLRK